MMEKFTKEYAEQLAKEYANGMYPISKTKWAEVKIDFYNGYLACAEETNVKGLREELQIQKAMNEAIIDLIRDGKLDTSKFSASLIERNKVIEEALNKAK